MEDSNNKELEMARTSAAEVKQILSTSLDDTIVEAFIAGATEVITEVLGDDTTITDALKAEIERWYTAHMIASTREQQSSKEEAGSAKVTYQGQTGAGLSSTFYGQQVLIMDTTGKMASLGGKSASIYAVTSFD